MKALIIDTAEKPWEETKGFKQVELDKPILDEANNPADAVSVIIKLKYMGVCGSDRGLYYRNAFKDQFNKALDRDNRKSRVVGHEFLGEIVEAGSMVETLYSDPDPNNPDKLTVGKLVTGDSHITCGRCYQCRIGQANVCANEAIMGITIDGIFAEYAKLPAKNLWAVNTDRIRPEVAAIMDPFGNAVHAASKVDVRGKRVVIFGCGPIGLFTLLVAQKFGAGRVIMVDVNPKNLELAKQLGADSIIQIQPKERANYWEADQEAIDKIMELTYGRGVDVAFEMAGPASSINNAINSTRRGGEVVLFGVKDGDLTIPQFPRIISSGLTIHCIIGREIFKTWQTAQRLLAQKSNGIQDKIWNVILNKGEGNIIPFQSFSQDTFESKMDEWTKVIFKA